MACRTEAAAADLHTAGATPVSSPSLPARDLDVCGGELKSALLKRRLMLEPAGTIAVTANKVATDPCDCDARARLQ